MTFQAVIECVILVVVLVGMFLTYRTNLALADRMLDRHKALDQHFKAVSRDAQRVKIAAENALAEAQHVREDTRATQQHINAALADPRIQALLNGVAGG